METLWICPREENRLVFSKMLAECKENEDYVKAARSKHEYFSAESLFMVLILQQQKTINDWLPKCLKRQDYKCNQTFKFISFLSPFSHPMQRQINYELYKFFDLYMLNYILGEVWLYDISPVFCFFMLQVWRPKFLPVCISESY